MQRFSIHAIVDEWDFDHTDKMKEWCIYDIYHVHVKHNSFGYKALNRELEACYSSRQVININRFFFLLFFINRYLCLHLIVTKDILSFLECKICMIVSKLLCLNVSYLYNQEMNMNQYLKSLLKISGTFSTTLDTVKFQLFFNSL